MPKNLRSGKTTLKSPKTSAKKQRGEKAKRASKGKQKQPEEKDEVDLSMVGIGHPEIFPLVLTTRTQEIFNCRVDEDVTEENCFKLIKKDDIIQDLKTRAAISDFHPVKNIVLEYPGEELLIVFDANFQYGQNFYLVASEEAKENFLKPPETAEEIDSEEEKEETQDVCAYKPPVSKPWVSLGSEKEVEEESQLQRPQRSPVGGGSFKPSTAPPPAHGRGGRPVPTSPAPGAALGRSLREGPVPTVSASGGGGGEEGRLRLPPFRTRRFPSGGRSAGREERGPSVRLYAALARRDDFGGVGGPRSSAEGESGTEAPNGLGWNGARGAPRSNPFSGGWSI